MAAAPLPFALRTYRAVHPDDGELRRHDGYWSVTTPANPSFFWGNFLQFDRPPIAGDAQRWPALFARHVAARQPLSTHVALCWEADAEGEVAEFAAAGYQVLDHVVMTADTLRPAPEPAGGARLRRLDGDADWQALVGIMLRNREPEFSAEGYEAYARPRVAQWRAASAAGAAGDGAFVGAFVDTPEGEVLAASLGLFAERAPGPDGLTLARFQEVETDARFRRRGLCSALLALAPQVLDAASPRRRIDRLVIVTEASGPARSVYAARGFEVRARLGCLQHHGPVPAARSPGPESTGTAI